MKLLKWAMRLLTKYALQYVSKTVVQKLDLAHKLKHRKPLLLILWSSCIFGGLYQCQWIHNIGIIMPCFTIPLNEEFQQT